MQNKYPFHLEKQLIDLYLSTVKKVNTSKKSESSKIDIPSLRNKVAICFKQIDSWSSFTLENYLLSLKKSDLQKINLYNLESVLKRVYFPNKEAIQKLNKKQLKSDSVGINTIIGQPGITEDFINSTVETNVGLIRDLEDDTRKKIQQAISAGVQSGLTVEELTKEIERIAGISESRARFWAQDQSSKFFGAVTRQRQMAIGYDGFIWICVKDGKVRPTHLEFEGKYFDWQNGTGVNKRNFPGQDYRCRCFAKPAFQEDAPDEKQYKQEAEKARWKRQKETQQAQIEFDKLYEQLTTEAKEAIMSGSKLEIGIIIDQKGNETYLIGGVNYVEIPNNINMEGKIFTHNHPMNGLISDADLEIFLESKMKELRVVTKDHTYSISNNSKKTIDYKEFKEYFDSIQEEARGKFYKNLKNKNLDSMIEKNEILNIQWEMASNKFGLIYRRL